MNGKMAATFSVRAPRLRYPVSFRSAGVVVRANPETGMLFRKGDYVHGKITRVGAKGMTVELTDYPGFTGFVRSIDMPFFLDSSDGSDGSELAGRPTLDFSGLNGSTREFRVVSVPSDLSTERGPLLEAKSVDRGLVSRRLKQIYDVVSLDKEVLTGVVAKQTDGGMVVKTSILTAYVSVKDVVTPDGRECSMDDMRQQYPVGASVRFALVRQDKGFKPRGGGGERNSGGRDRSEGEGGSSLPLPRFTASLSRVEEWDACRKIKVGALLKGTVRRIEEFGAYVGIQGTRMSGLLHVSNLSGRYIAHTSDLFQIGDEIQVIVMGVEDGYKDISLSTAELEQYPGQIQDDREAVWTSAEDKAKEFRERLSAFYDDEQDPAGGDKTASPEGEYEGVEA